MTDVATPAPPGLAPPCLSRYRVEGVIGQGPCGTVFKAHDPVGERPVVIKALKREVALRALGPRLLEQARIAARLAHPGIVAIHDVEQSDTASVIVMEFVAGRNLADWLAASPLPPADSVVQVMDRVLEAVGHAHQAGIRHGALHTGNVLVTAAGQVKVSDFGMARAGEPATLAAASRGLVAPEIGQGRPLDFGVDIYAAGVLLYRLLTGRDPELGVAVEGGMGAVRAPSTFVEARRAALFDTIVARALAREPGDRYEGTDAFRAALAGALEAPRPVHGTQNVDIAPGETVAEARSPQRIDIAVPAQVPAMRARLALVRSNAAPSRAAPPSAVRERVDEPTCDIAIPDAVLHMPAFDPWLEATPGRSGASPQANGPLAANESIGASEAPRLRALLGQAEQGRRAHVASAARAANEALAVAAAARPEGEFLIEAEAFDPPSESVFQGEEALWATRPAGSGIPVEALRRVLKILTPHFGERTGTVLKQVAGQAADVAELHALLLARAGETVDRRRLKKQLQALARLPL